MKKTLLFALLVTLTLPAFASKEEKATALMEALNAKASLNVAYDQVLENLSCQFLLTPAQESTLKEDLIKTLDVESFVKTLNQFWIQNFTEQELDEVLNFYKTPAGKKQIALMPEYTKFMMAEQKKWGISVMPKMIEFGKRVEEQYPKRPDQEVNECLATKQGKSF